MHKATISGNVIADAELRYTNDGKPMITFRVAVNSREKDRDGEYVDVAYYYRVVTMPRSDSASDYLTNRLMKGARVLVVGDLKASAYTPRDGGDPRLSFDIAFPDVIEVYSKALVSDNGNDQEEAPTPAPASNGKNKSATKPARQSAAAATTAAPVEPMSATDLEDLPF